MGIGTLRRHWDSEPDPEGHPVASEDLEGLEGTSTPGSDSEAAGDTVEGSEDAIPTPARNASKQVWLDYYEAAGLEVDEDAGRDDLAEAVLGSK